LLSEWLEIASSVGWGSVLAPDSFAAGVDWVVAKGIFVDPVDCAVGYVIVRPLSTVGYTSIAASVIHSRQRSN